MKMSIEKRKRYTGWIFISPFIIGFLLFFVYPLMMTIYISFFNVDQKLDFFGAPFIGLKNYLDAFVTDIKFIPYFFEVSRDTLIKTLFITAVSLIVAILINQNIKGKGLFRLIFFLPAILGTGYAAQTIYSGLETMPVGISNIPIFQYFSADIQEKIKFMLNAMNHSLWSSCVQAVIFLAGLQAVPESLYEASKIDGASGWESFWKITLPMLTPIVLVNIVYTIVDSFTSSTNTLMNYIYEAGIGKQHFSFAAAMGMMYFLFILLVVVLVFLAITKKTNYVEER